MHKVTAMTVFILILASVISNYDFISVNATSEPNDIIQIPSEPTDFPENNQETLDILFSKTTSNSDSVHVLGSIKNTGQDTLRYVDVTAHFFDENNQTVGVTTCCYADPTDIEPGHTSSFDSFSSFDQMTSEPRYYKLSFEWDSTESNAVDSTLNIGSEVSCGDIVKSDVILTSDLFCSGDGLIIQDESDLTIDLNNHTISGPGVKSQMAGLLMGNSNKIVLTGPGIIENFQSGVLFSGGEDNKISRVTFTQNEIAIFQKGSKNTAIEDNLLFGNNIGVAAHSSSGSKLTTNLIKSNDLAGVTLVDSNNNEISSNTIMGSLTGIFLDGQSTDNNVDWNNVLQNRGVDLNNGNGLPTETNDNTFADNNCNNSLPDGLCLGR